MLGNIIWLCPFGPGTAADVLICDGYGPSRTRGDFFDFEVGGHDGAHKGRIHVIVPFIGRKNGTLTARQQCYNDAHGWYRAHIEQPAEPNCWLTFWVIFWYRSKGGVTDLCHAAQCNRKPNVDTVDTGLAFPLFHTAGLFHFYFLFPFRCLNGVAVSGNA